MKPLLWACYEMTDTLLKEIRIWAGTKVKKEMSIYKTKREASDEANFEFTLPASYFWRPAV